MKLAEVETKAFGIPRLPLVVVPHPVGGMGAEAVRRKAQDAYEAVLAAILEPARVRV